MSGYLGTGKKRAAQILLLSMAVVMGLMAMILPVQAADVDGALYIADIVATNSGEAATDVAAALEINDQAMINGKYITEDLLNTTIQTAGGADVPYMPGVGENPWIYWLSSIGASESKPYSFYCGGPAMQEGFVYFPDDGGMTSDDDASLEPGDTFRIEQKVYIDTSAGASKYLVFKDGAIQIYISAAGSIKAEVWETTPGSATFYPDPNVEVSSVDGEVVETTDADWATMRAAAGDSANDSLASDNPVRIASAGGANTWSDLQRSIFLFDTSSLPDDATIISATFSVYGLAKADTFAPAIAPDVNVYSSAPASNTALAAGDYDSLGTTAFCDTPITYAGFNTAGYNDFSLNASGLAAINTTGVSMFGLRNACYDAAGVAPTWSASHVASFTTYFADQALTDKDPKLVVTYEVPPAVSITVTGISSGERKVVVVADGTDLTLEVYDANDILLDSDTAPLSGASIPNNGNNWSFITNGSILYLEYQKIWVGGTLVQHIVYERDTTFHDQTAYDNDVTPTFITATTDPDVDVAFLNFRPIDESEYTDGTGDGDGGVITTVPEEPEEFYTGSGTGFDHLPGAELINTMLDSADFPRDLFWIWFVYGVAAVAVLLGYQFIRSSLLFPALMGFVIILGAALTCHGDPIELWTILPYGLMSAGFIVSERVFGW
jgi:hypothetical protein